MFRRLVIGLFGFVGMVGVALAIPVGRLIDRLVPWSAAVVSITFYIIITAIGVGADGLNIASVVIVCIGVDVLRQTIQITMTTWVFGLDPKARSRINAIILVAVGLAHTSSRYISESVCPCSCLLAKSWALLSDRCCSQSTAGALQLPYRWRGLALCSSRYFCGAPICLDIVG